jgi:hypothetical protein
VSHRSQFSTSLSGFANLTKRTDLSVLLSARQTLVGWPKCFSRKPKPRAHDFEIDAEENPDKVRLEEILGLHYVLKV